MERSFARIPTIDKCMVGISTAFPGNFVIRAIESGGSPTYTIFRIEDTTLRTIMDHGLIVDEGIELGTTGASISNDGGDVIVMLGN